MSASSTHATANLFPSRAARLALVLAALAAAALLATLPSTARAQSSQLSVGLTVEDRQITVGDPLALTIYAVYPDDYHVIFPTLPQQWGSFEVRTQTPQATVINEDLTRTARQLVEVALFAPGDHQTPTFNISFRGPEGQIVERPVASVDVHVTSVLDPEDRLLRDIRPQADITVPSLWPWTLGAASLALLGLIVFAMRRRRTSVGLLAADWVEQRTPFQIAMERLDQIRDMDLPAGGRFKEHYSLVTDVVREYLQREYSVTAPERTTAETRLALRTSPVPAGEGNGIVEVLEDGDLVKFTEIAPGSDASWDAFDRTRSLIEAIRPQEPIPAAPETREDS